MEGKAQKKRGCESSVIKQGMLKRMRRRRVKWVQGFFGFILGFFGFVFCLFVLLYPFHLEFSYKSSEVLISYLYTLCWFTVLSLNNTAPEAQ